MLVGRPRLQVLEEHLQTLHNDAGFRWANIGRILGISDQALHRRRREFGLQVGMGEHFSDITDDERDVNLSEILQATPNTCQGLGEGGLRHRGLCIHTRKQYSECQCLLTRPSCWVESTQQNKKSTAYPVSSRPGRLRASLNKDANSTYRQASLKVLFNLNASTTGPDLPSQLLVAPDHIRNREAGKYLYT